MRDWQLLRQYATDGSQSAFSELVTRHLRQVYATCYRDTQDGQMAEDTTQAVFLVLAKKAPHLRPKASLATWLFAVSRLAAKDALKRERRRVIRERKAADEMLTAQQQSEDATWQAIDPVLNDAIASLKPAERDAILLRFFHEMTMAETGESLGISEAAAKMRVSRALDHLRHSLAKSRVTIPAATLAALLTAHSAAAAPSLTAATVTNAVLTIGTGTAAGLIGSSLYQISQGVIRTMWMTKLKIAALAAIVCIVGGGAATMVARSQTTAPVPPQAAVAPAAQPPPQTSTTIVDPRAQKLLDQMSAAYKALTSYSATVLMNQREGAVLPRYPEAAATVAFVRPNRIAIKPFEIPKSTRTNIAVQVVSDGTNLYRPQSVGSIRYLKLDIPSDLFLISIKKSNLLNCKLPDLLTQADPFQLYTIDGYKRDLSLGAPGKADGVRVDTVIMTVTGVREC